MNRAERRIYKRIFFSMKNGPTAWFNLPNPDKRIFAATVMDLSPGGLGLSVRKDENLGVNVGSRMLLTEVRMKNLHPVINIETEVKWVQNYEGFQHILFGCEFLDISERVRDQIENFIHLWADKIAPR